MAEHLRRLRAHAQHVRLPAGRADDAAATLATGGLNERVDLLTLDLESSPERLWPLVSDTNRFNRDAGIPSVEPRGRGDNARRRLRLSKLGVPLEWEEEPFEWESPRRFSVSRRYLAGPFESMRTSLELEPRETGGTRLTYEVRVRPRGLVGRIVTPVAIGLVARRRFTAIFRRYDAAASGAEHEQVAPSARRVRLAAGAASRIATARARLVAAGQDEHAVGSLCALVERGDDLAVARIRPYELAGLWGIARRLALELCLHATRAGLLELRWELLCPLCRGAAAVQESLADASGTFHCDTCLIDYAADFERSVEITFRPSAAIREPAALDFCVAGPQITPHVVAQQLVPPEASRVLRLRVEPGGYRLRALGVGRTVAVLVTVEAPATVAVHADGEGWSAGELRIAPGAEVTLRNRSGEELLVVVERTAWSDLAATAAEVTALQVFRDLFAAEALRPGEPVSVGSLAVAFTDLRGSTRYYREVGDAPAFGSVLGHLDVLRDAVREEGGSVVKTMGDAIMAVFPRPVSAVRAMRAAQLATAGRPLALKVGLHYGPCIAVEQNGVLDYFGSAVNLASRLAGVSSGDDLVVTEAVLSDPEVAALGLPAAEVDVSLKGFEDAAPRVWRVPSDG